MAVEADLRTLLLTFDAVTALVGTGGTARIRPDKLEQDDDETQPHIVIEVDNEEPLNTLDGLGGRLYCDVTIRCRALTKAGARALAEAVRLNGTDPGTGLAGYSGTVNGKTFDAVLMSQQATHTPLGDGSDRSWYDIFCQYTCTFEETV